MSAKKTFLENQFEKYQKLWDELDEITLKDINYSRKQLELDLEHVRLWLRDQHHLPECRLTESDNFLTMYLTGCKGSLETVKRKLDAYYSLRGKSEIYRDRDPLDENYRKMSDLWCQCVIPKPSAKGVVIFFATFSEKFDGIPLNAMANTFKRSISIFEMGMRIKGITNPAITVLDFGRYPASVAALYTPAILKDVTYLIENVFPLRIQKIICLNVSPFLEFVINSIIKPFQNKKVRERFIVTTKGYEELLKYVNKEDLPKDMLGDFPLTFQEINDAWNGYEIENRDWFMNELSEEVDETKRIDTGVKHVVHDALFGVQGTLKKLVVD